MAKHEAHANESLAKLLLALYGSLGYDSPACSGASMSMCSFSSPRYHSLPDRRVQLRMQADEGEFDTTQTGFDFLERRSFRRDTLMKYSQSFRARELRLLFFASSALLAASCPFYYGEVFRELFGETGSLDTVGFLACATSTVLFGGLTALEKSNRGKTLLKMDREQNLSELSICQPSDSLRRQGTRISSLRGKLRLVAIYGSPSVLESYLNEAYVYRKRLAQSGVALVIVPCANQREAPDLSKIAFGDNIWQPTSLKRWQDYFEDVLSGGQGTPKQVASTEGAWFAISLQGLSCASAVGAIAWDELLGTKFPPLRALSPSKERHVQPTPEEDGLLIAQKQLYEALAFANISQVSSFFSPVDDPEVTVLAENGRLDPWSTVLKYDATIGITLFSQESSIDSKRQRAFTTGIELPQGSSGATLLSTQRWVKVGSQDGAVDWKLEQHRTIPYSLNLDAPACLRCDHRGCVALQRFGSRGPAGMPGDGAA